MWRKMPVWLRNVKNQRFPKQFLLHISITITASQKSLGISIHICPISNTSLLHISLRWRIWAWQPSKERHNFVLTICIAVVLNRIDSMTLSFIRVDSIIPDTGWYVCAMLHLIIGMPESVITGSANLPIIRGGTAHRAQTPHVSLWTKWLTDRRDGQSDVDFEISCSRSSYVRPSLGKITLSSHSGVPFRSFHIVV